MWKLSSKSKVIKYARVRQRVDQEGHLPKSRVDGPSGFEGHVWELHGLEDLGGGKLWAEEKNLFEFEGSFDRAFEECVWM